MLLPAGQELPRKCFLLLLSWGADRGRPNPGIFLRHRDRVKLEREPPAHAIDRGQYGDAGLAKGRPLSPAQFGGKCGGRVRPWRCGGVGIVSGGARLRTTADSGGRWAAAGPVGNLAISLGFFAASSVLARARGAGVTLPNTSDLAISLPECGRKRASSPPPEIILRFYSVLGNFSIPLGQEHSVRPLVSHLFSGNATMTQHKWEEPFRASGTTVADPCRP
jgi:hypothetical protein